MGTERHPLRWIETMTSVAGDRLTKAAGRSDRRPCAYDVGVLRVRHLFRLLGDVSAYTVASRSWWVLPVVVALVGLLAAATATGAAVPYTMYTLF